MPVPKGTRVGGRKKGTPNKVTADVKAAAQAFTNDALETLATIMRDDTQPAAARVSAANVLLDRGHGKPAQAIIGGDENDPAIKQSLTVRFLSGSSGNGAYVPRPPLGGMSVVTVGAGGAGGGGSG